MTGRKRAARADGDAPRARLLEVAGQLFARLGYAGAANKAICEAAGTDLAAINYHFGGRDGLYQAVLFEGYEQLINLQKLKEIHARQDSAENKLSAAIDMIVDRLYDEGGWHGRVFARELVAPSTHLAALVREGVMPRFKLMSDILSEVTGFSAQDPALLRCVLSVIAPMLMMLVVDRDTPTPFRALMTRPADELKSHLKHFALAGLLATKEQASRRGS